MILFSHSRHLAHLYFTFKTQTKTYFERLNVVIAIVSNAWDDSVDDTREVFWKSRVEVLFQYRVFKNVIGTDSFFLGPLFKQIDKVGICSISGKMSFWKLLISVTINVFWFVLGLFTFGLLWPKKLRYRILHAGM